MDKIEQQLTFVQQEVMKLKNRMLKLELHREAKYYFINIIREQIKELKIERNGLIKEKKDTRFNGGQLHICNKLINLLKVD